MKKKQSPNTSLTNKISKSRMDLQFCLEKNRIEIGCDEAGRGCLAGPVVAAAVILDPKNPIDGKKPGSTVPLVSL